MRDLVFLAQLVEAVEAVRVGIGAEHLDAEGLAELEDLAIGVGVLGEVLHAPAKRRDLVLLAQLEQGGDLYRRAFKGSVLLVQLDVMQAQVLDALQGRFQVEFAECVALHTEVKAAERFIFFSWPRRRFGRADSPRGDTSRRKARRSNVCLSKSSWSTPGMKTWREPG